MARNRTGLFLLFALCFSAGVSRDLTAQGSAAKHYEPTIESLDTHPLPAWYDEAKLGIFIHWGLYSVPAWAEPQDPKHVTGGPGNTPYAEWYYNSMRNPGSPTQKYHEQHYGADYNYYNFAPIFNKETKKWKPEEMAGIFRDAGAKYVVLTSKHHEGFTLWPSKVVNPNQNHLNAERDIVGELSEAVRKDGMKMGLYYSGGYDWTFNRGPIVVDHDYAMTEPQTSSYGKYADAQVEELIAKYHPSVLWNDINWPKSGNPMQDEADYYNAVPDGVIDDRWGINHYDFSSPEYSKLNEISEKKWEECRGIGLSFGYNRAETDVQTMAPREVIELLVDIVSKNGNLLLDVGPEADGTIPAIQLDRLKKLGAWLKQNGEAIYGTKPWTHANGDTDQVDAEGRPVDLRFTQKDGHVFVTMLGKPVASTVVLHNLAPAAGSKMTLLGSDAPVKWKQKAADLEVTLPSAMPGEYDWVLKMEPGK